MNERDKDQTGAGQEQPDPRSVGADTGNDDVQHGLDVELPKLTVPEGADLHLAEPQLETAAISDDVAESTSLNDVGAEAAQAAEEAQATGAMVAGSEFKAPPAPSLPTAEVTHEDPGAVQEKSKAARISAAGRKKPLFTPRPPADKAEAASVGAGEQAETGSGDGTGRPDEPGTPGSPGGPGGPNGPGEPASGGNRRLFVVIGVAVVAVLLIIGLIWLLVSLLNGDKDTSTAADTASIPTASASITGTASISPQPTPGATPSAAAASTASATSTASPSGNGLITADAPPLKWAKGDCFRAFKDASQNADIVNCATPHAAQLVATYSYPEAGSYPGLDALKAKAADTCSSVKLSSAANNYAYKPKSGYPSESTWAKGDRRVDCIVVDNSGDNIRESLLS